MTTLRVRNVGLVYPGLADHNEIVALKGVNLTMERGDFVVALGASGCGKTTLALSALRPTDTRAERAALEFYADLAGARDPEGAVGAPPEPAEEGPDAAEGEPVPSD